MANHNIKNPHVFNENVRKFETTDKGHADIFNVPPEILINNDVYIKKKLETHEADVIKHLTAVERSKWNDKYTKNEIDNKFSTLETSIDWKEAVATYADIVKTYPTPVDGWTVNVKDTDYTYRYTGSKWVAISANAIPKATQVLDGLLSKEDKINLDDTNTKKHTHGNKSIIDTITQVLINNWNAAFTHISDAVKHITGSERTLWNTVSNKVDKITGKGLSTEDYTTAEKSKLGNIATGANNYTHPTNHPASIITQDANNRFMTDVERTKLNGIATGANNYILPVANGITLGGIKTGGDITMTSGVATVLDNSHSHTIANTTGLQGALDGKAISTHTHTPASIGAVDSSGTIVVNRIATFSDTAGNIKDSGFTIATSVPAGAKFTDTIYTHPTNHPASIITQDASNRFMTDVERNKLNAIATGANNYVLPVANGTILGGIKTGGDITMASGVATVLDNSHNHTIANTTGLQSALDGKATTNHGNHVPTVQTANNAIYLRNDNTWQTITPVEIGAVDSNGTIVANRIATFADTVGNIKDSGFTIATSVPAGAKFTDTIYTHPAEHPASMIKSVPGSINEIGQYLDFHEAGSNVDYNVRLYAKGDRLAITSPVIGDGYVLSSSVSYGELATTNKTVFGGINETYNKISGKQALNNNANTLGESGFYVTNANTAGIPEVGLLISQVWDGNYALQIWHKYGMNELYFRRKLGNVWDGGTKIATGDGIMHPYNQTNYSTEGSLNLSTTGQNNTAIGFQALKANTTGRSNTVIGSGALRLSTTGSHNTAIGNSTLSGISTEKCNTAIGAQALNYNQYSNCTGIGYNTTVTGNNQVQLGDLYTTTFAFGAVQNRSDKRDKADIEFLKYDYYNFIKNIKPVQFRWDYRDDYDEYIEKEAVNKDGEKEIAREKISHERDGSKKRNRLHNGFIAQEVKKVADDLNFDFAGYQDHSIGGGKDVLSMGYEEFIAPMIATMQDMMKQISDIQEKIEKIKK